MKNGPDEEGIATYFLTYLSPPFLDMVRNIDLMKKGLRLYRCSTILVSHFIGVRNIDLMKKGLKALLEAEQERITLGVLL